MKIGIIGGGSIGLLFSAYLGRQHTVTIYTRRNEQADTINKNGIHLYKNDQRIVQHVYADTDTANFRHQHFIIIAVKQYDLEQLITDLRNIPRHIPVCFVQNGMGHLKLLESLPQQYIFVGSVEHGAERINDYCVSHNGGRNTNIAPFKGSSDWRNVFPEMKDADFLFTFYENYEDVLLNKLIANAVINPLTVIFRVKNGQLVKNKYFYKVFRELFADIIQVFPNLDRERSLLNLENICLNTKENTSSMLKDYEEGKQLETDAILGYIIETAEKRNITLKIVHIIYSMIQGIEAERSYP